MNAVIGKWGNGAGLRIPQPFLKQLKLAVGDVIDFRVKDDKIIIAKPAPTLDDLLSQCSGENPHGEMFIEPIGKELL